ncbi:pectate lyase-like protein [Albidovulum inexpectatum]|uniref:Pectate lyase-like protein n=1 Tax=Albidovulum inexpectatum TaxID=196587 RepID=A0A2S5JDG2_9RHOB|nr:glycosyl hydrolase family 28-related protein [Albidovulum inexpectatum]PPB79527.1 pectate lyase-like protein [Albidovulum inexpectatum]
MNKAITDGLIFMPPAFEAGLDVWSSGDGSAGSPTWQGAANAAIVTADQDFGSCLELQKLSDTTRLRYMGQTPILPGCYLRIRARVKAMSGNLPTVRIAGWAGGAGDTHVAGVVEVGPAVTLSSYGKVETVEAIVGTGSRPGVDMAWGTGAIYGHFGLDLTGPNGGVVRVDDIEIEDITSVFLREMMDWVDVRDYGAVGDGVTDDSAAFDAADAAAVARGGSVLVPAGTYFLDASVTMEAPVRFEGRVVMPDNRRLSLTRSFDLPTYADAFGDEELGFRKAFQALLNWSDHDSLDLKGRRIEVTAPIDMQAAVNNKTTFASRRVIRNGQFNVIPGPAWDPVVVKSQASYSTSAPTMLTNVVNAANIPVGALVEGVGVGREVYVTDVNVGAGTVTLSKPLYGAAGTQVYTFTRFKYVLDFSGFQSLSQMVLEDVDIQCGGVASGIMLAPAGIVFQIRDSFIANPSHRGITSIGRGCQGIMIDRCQFISAEGQLNAQDRQSIGFNVNGNDAKIRDCRALNFRHFGVLSGAGHVISGNHFFQADSQTQGVRLAGLVLIGTDLRTAITGNSIDNAFVEWTNEHEADPDFANQYSFGGLTITGNVFTVSDVAPWFSWIVVKPYGAGHFIQSLAVTSNAFKAYNGRVDRIEKVDTTFAVLDNSRMRNIRFEGNTFTGVDQVVANPVLHEHVQASAATTWVIDAGSYLPFGGWARVVESIVPMGKITGASNERRSDMPYVEVEQGAGKQQVTLNWLAASKGTVRVAIRMDQPH